MKYGVSSNTLLLTAGIVWLVAGINILRIGISCWITDAHYWLLKVCEASLIFLLFFCMIFHKLYRKHAQRITTGSSNKRCPFLHIPADTRSAFPVISVQSPVSIQCCWQS